MSVSGTITKYLSQDEQLKALSDLIQNDQIEEILNIFNATSIDFSNDEKLACSIII